MPNERLMKIIKYALIVQESPQELVLTVNNAIQNGWQPVGSAFATRHAICQTLMQYDAENTYDIYAAFKNALSNKAAP